MQHHYIQAGAILSLLFMMVVSGCAQVSDRKDYMESVIGRDFSDIRVIYLSVRRRPAESNWTFREYRWNEEVLKLPGNLFTRYMYTNPFRDCVLVFEVGSDGVVKNTFYKGAQC